MSFKKVISIVISISLVFCITPNIVFAEKDDSAFVADNISEPANEPVAQLSENQNAEHASVEELQARIDVLPSVEEFQLLDKDKQDEIYREIQRISDECDRLTEHEQEQYDITKVVALSEYFNEQIEPSESFESWYRNVTISNVTNSGVNLRTVDIDFTWSGGDSDRKVLLL